MRASWRQSRGSASSCRKRGNSCWRLACQTASRCVRPARNRLSRVRSGAWHANSLLPAPAGNGRSRRDAYAEMPQPEKFPGVGAGRECEGCDGSFLEVLDGQVACSQSD